MTKQKRINNRYIEFVTIKNNLTENGCLAFFKLSTGDFAVKAILLGLLAFVPAVDLSALFEASASTGISKTII